MRRVDEFAVQRGGHRTGVGELVAGNAEQRIVGEGQQARRRAWRRARSYAFSARRGKAHHRRRRPRQGTANRTVRTGSSNGSELQIFQPAHSPSVIQDWGVKGSPASPPSMLACSQVCPAGIEAILAEVAFHPAQGDPSMALDPGNPRTVASMACAASSPSGCGRLRPRSPRTTPFREEILAEMQGAGPVRPPRSPRPTAGSTLSMEEECLVGIELGHTSPAFRSAFGTNVGIRSPGAGDVRNGRAEGPPGCRGSPSGETVTSFALTESEAGSDSASVLTSAILDGDAYVLNWNQALHHQRQQGRPVHGDGAHRSEGEGRGGRHRLPRSARAPRAFPPASPRRR